MITYDDDAEDGVIIAVVIGWSNEEKRKPEGSTRMTRKPSKAQRRAALAELPPECDMAEATTTSEIGVAKSITIHQDGRELHGSTWIKPQDFATDEVERGDLGSLKGCTPPTLPTLDSDQAREVTHDNA